MAKDKKKARKSQATIVFLDESGISTCSNLIRTWAPIGNTPIIKNKLSYKKISVIGAICTKSSGRKGKMFFRLHPNKSVKAFDCVEFIKQLQQNIKGKLIIIWDHLRSHHSNKVLKYVQGQKKIEIEFLPAYAPELNPVEYGWSYLKTKPLANFPCYDFDSLKLKTKRSICQMRVEKRLVKSFLNASGLF